MFPDSNLDIKEGGFLPSFLKLKLTSIAKHEVMLPLMRDQEVIVEDLREHLFLFICDMNQKEDVFFRDCDL